MINFLDSAYSLVWGMPALCLILGIGIWLTFKTRLIQLRLFPVACKLFVTQFLGKGTSERTSSYRALCTALAATVGTGNLIGVSGAICLGGPGAVFWMIVCAFLGMVVKFAEAVLAVRYRVSVNQRFRGGPMYIITEGLGKSWHPLAWCYSILGIFACFGIGNSVQINAIVSGIHSISETNTPSSYFIGAVIAILLCAAFSGGSRSIGGIVEHLVPIAAGSYIFMSLVFLICKANAIPRVLLSILEGAFSPKAVTGGIIGSAFRVLQIGCSRGIFTNEAGMGTAAIAHSDASVSHPIQQGMMGIVEVFIDTVVICTLTALVILCSGVSIPYGSDGGAMLTVNAFSEVYGKWGRVTIAVFLSCFAFATVLGWSHYGLRCLQFITGDKYIKWFYAVQITIAFVSANLNTPAIWRLSEILNGLMMFPNLIALWILTPELNRIIHSYPT